MKSLEERLWSRVNKPSESSCWEWTGPVNSKGYGGIGYFGRPIGVHVLAYILANHVEPKNVDVCHSCDNPRCCNPAHLFLGSRKANMADCVQKQRNYHPKLTEIKVREIRRLWATGDYTQTSLGPMFGVSQSMIGKIVNGKVWKHIL